MSLKSPEIREKPVMSVPPHPLLPHMSASSDSSRHGVELNDRSRAVLYAVVTEFIATGEPVGSRTLSSRYGLGLSAATIRNVLKDLEDDGLLSQPHKSAGRVPMRLAYQVFIDALMKVGHLNPRDEGRIRALFDDQLERTTLLRETGRLLTELGGVPSVVVQARSESRSVQKVRFIPTRPNEILSVIVLDDGSVENRFIPVEGSLPLDQLDRVHALLDEVAEGRSLRGLKSHLSEMADRERSELGALTRLSEGLLSSALDGVENTQEVIIEGHSSLFSASGDPERTKRLMVALEDRKQLLRLLKKTLDSQNVQVFLGEDADVESSLSVVAASFRRPGADAEGALGLLGPARMDYPQLVPLVGAVARAMGEALLDENRELAAHSEDPEPDPSENS